MIRRISFRLFLSIFFVWFLFWLTNILPGIEERKMYGEGNWIDYQLIDKKVIKGELRIENKNLYRLELSLKNPSLISDELLNLKIRKGNGDLLKNLDFSAFNIGDPSDLRIDLDETVDFDEKLIYELKVKKGGNTKIKVALMNGKPMWKLFYKNSFSLKRGVKLANQKLINLLTNGWTILLIPI
ncbi:hypothetical protein DRH14_01995, partial [Candidatus Shapirobacteria bacterium]